MGFLTSSAGQQQSACQVYTNAGLACLFYSFLSIVPQIKHYSPHFVDNETETQRDEGPAHDCRTNNSPIPLKNHSQKFGSE